MRSRIYSVITARIMVNRLFEDAEDLNIHSEIERLTSSPYPNIDLESEGNHWNVYKKATPRSVRGFIGEIYYDDMTDAPVDVMTPEARQFWDTHRWVAIAGFRNQEQKPCASFEDALNFVLAINTAKTTQPMAEAQETDPDDPSINIEKFARERSAPTEATFTDNGRSWRVRIVWDKPTGGLHFDYAGDKVPEKLQPTVEFFDLHHANDLKYPSFLKNGQFVGSYYASTLVGEHVHGDGLDLHGSVPVWQLSGDTMNMLIHWIKREVESRGYKLVDDEINGINLGTRYEGLDPDDPELYAHPERFTQQPSDEKIEGALRRILAPYYTRVSISKRPGMFSGRDITDSFIWTIHCNRDTPLPLSLVNRSLPGYKLDWRQEVKHWFEKWAAQSNLSLFKFKIYGRLRKDPTFQFETARMGPLKENDEDLTPEVFLRNYVDKQEVDRELTEALWQFHPYGVGYNVLLGPRGGFVSVSTYFPPEKDRFIERFRDFTLSWLKERKVMTVHAHKLTAWQVDKKHQKQYPRWSIMLALNSDWPPGQPSYVAPTVEVGQPGILPSGLDAPQS
jgi:hypothetical protein